MIGTDPHSFDGDIGKIGTDAVKGLTEGAAEVIQRGRQEEKDSIQRGDVSTQDLTGYMNALLQMLPPPGGQPAAGVSGQSAGKVTGADVMANFHKDQYELMVALTRSALDSLVESTAKAVEASKEHGKKLDALAIAEDFERLFALIRHEGTQGVLTPHSVTAAAVIMAGFLSVAATGRVDPSDPFQKSAVTIQEMVNTGLQMVPSDMRAELGLLGAWMAGPMLFQALALTVAGTEGTAPKQDITQDFATNYAGRLLKLMSDDGFNGLLKTIIQARAPGEGIIPDQQMNAYMAAFKLGLLMSAFAMFYKAETGGLSGTEVLQQIASQSYEEAGRKAPLLDAIRQQLSALSPEEREKVLLQFADFLDSKPDVDSLMDPLKVFLSVGVSAQEVAQERPSHLAA